jgi:aspartyl-tRNA(Asn)/glutamyl-tRNA(Gln) amidotransferase subunit A
MKLNELSIKEAHEGLKAGKFSAVDLTRACLDRIDETNDELRAVLQIRRDEALSEAAAADVRLKTGSTLGMMDGIPVMLKDNILMKGARASAGSRILENYVAPYDSTVAAKLKAAGAVVLGIANMDEFAMGSSTETSAYGQTRNPWDVSKIPGGSSGGSAAAVAARMCLAALGSDTGGSIRQPAAMCGVSGFKPTYGRVSRYGLMSMASSLDQIGPITGSVEDAKIVLETIGGQDPLDSTSAADDLFAEAGARRDLKGLKVGVPKEYFVQGMDPEVEVTVRMAMKKLEDLGAEMVEVSLPSTEHALAVYYVIMPCEVSANLARYDGMRFGLSVDSPTLKETYFNTRGQGFGKEVRRRVMIGAYALSAGYYDAYYLQAQKVRTKMKEEFAAALEQADVLLSPTSPSVAWSLGEKFDDPIAMYLTDIYTVSVNVVGAPAVSVPCGFVRGLPVGLQLIGRHFEDAKVLAIAQAYQDATDWHAMRPNI